MLSFPPFLDGLRLPFEHDPCETNLPATPTLPVSTIVIQIPRVHPFLYPQIYPRMIMRYLNRSINLFLNIAS